MSSLREINIKNHDCYYPDGMINNKDLDLDKILVFERPYVKCSFIYQVACKTLSGEKTFAY